MFRPFRVVFTLDSCGVVYNPAEPLHLDGILAWCRKRHHPHGPAPARDEPPDEISLPLDVWERNGEWGWCASSLQPVDGELAFATDTWRKRLRQDRLGLVAAGTPNTAMGPYRDWSMPLVRVLVRQLVGYGVGDIGEVRRELRRHVKALGARRRLGVGRVTMIEVEECDEDRSVIWRGRAQRWLPDPSGRRLVRPRPPYWNIVGRVRCLEVGDLCEQQREGQRWL